MQVRYVEYIVSRSILDSLIPLYSIIYIPKDTFELVRTSTSTSGYFRVTETLTINLHIDNICRERLSRSLKNMTTLI